jgi:HAD superfamily hydrolase (TIGR01509 family)
MKYKAFIFDFFGTLSEEVTPPWFDAHFPEDESKMLRSKYVRPGDLGNMTEEECFVHIAALVSKTPEQVRNEWLGLVKINDGLVSLIKELRATSDCKIALCSNAWSPFLREILEKNDLISIFDVIVISSEVQVMKPDTAIFTLVLEKLEVQAEEAVFVDDLPQNVHAAESAGIKSIQYSNLENLKAEFTQQNII